MSLIKNLSSNLSVIDRNLYPNNGNAFSRIIGYKQISNNIALELRLNVKRIKFKKDYLPDILVLKRYGVKNDAIAYLLNMSSSYLSQLLRNVSK